MNDLLEYGCIDFRKLLILKAKSLQLSDEECFILLLIMTMEDIGLKPITPSQISKLCSMSISRIDDTLISLIDKHMIGRKLGVLDLSPLHQKLINQDVKEEEKAIDMISVFENAFGRSLNQMEIQIIQGFKSLGYDDSMILDALNEAVKSGVLNFRYIEKILDNWARYGVKKRYAPQQSKEQIEVEQTIKDFKWWDENE